MPIDRVTELHRHQGVAAGSIATPMKTCILILAVLVPFAVFSQNDRPGAPPKANPEGSVADYKLIRDFDSSQLQHKVNEAIKMGWQPLGTVVVSPSDPQSGAGMAYLQAMTLAAKR
jgi:hypothetical protein